MTSVYPSHTYHFLCATRHYRRNGFGGHLTFCVSICTTEFRVQADVAGF